MLAIIIWMYVAGLVGLWMFAVERHQRSPLPIWFVCFQVAFWPLTIPLTFVRMFIARGK